MARKERGISNFERVLTCNVIEFRDTSRPHFSSCCSRFQRPFEARATLSRHHWGRGRERPRVHQVLQLVARQARLVRNAGGRRLARPRMGMVRQRVLEVNDKCEEG